MWSPPPDDDFPSYEKLLAYCTEHAFEAGHGLTVRDSKPTRKVLVCDRFGLPDHKNRNPGTHDSKRRPNAKSRKCDCKFALEGKLSKETGRWHLQVLPGKDDEHRVHNHTQDISNVASPLHRIQSLGKKEYDDIHNGFENQIPSKTIVSMHNAKSRHQLTPRDIYNLHRAWRVANLRGDTAVMALLRDLKEKGFWYKIEVDASSNKLTHLYLAHPKAIEVYKMHHELLLFDCTYKTNKFNMPVLNICGVTGNKKTAQIALVFLPNEKDPAYEWALQAHSEMMKEHSIPAPTAVVTDRETALINGLNTYFPMAAGILCRWHVNQNVVKNCKDQFFPKGEDYFDARGQRKTKNNPLWVEFYDAWRDLLASENEPQYLERLQQFTHHSPRYPDGAVAYCQGWLVWKEKLVSFLVSIYFTSKLGAN
jgi:MULE transposase domain